MPDRRETAGLTMRLIVEYVRLHHGDAGVARMLALADEQRPVSVLEDETVWSTYDQKIALFAAAAEVTGQADVARSIGETVLQSSVGTTLRVALGMLGSPGSLLRAVSRACGKFSTAGEMHAEQITRTSAVLHYRIFDGFALSHHDCDYTLGLLAQIPVLFGLPPARVEHRTCQIRGADECVYDLSWAGRSRLPWRRRAPQAVAAEALMARLHQLQATLADLVATTDVDDVLDTIARRAGSAVNAERFVFAARLDETSPPRVRYDGFDAADAQQVAASLLDDRLALRDGEHALVVDVATPTRSYGRLAAFASWPFFDHEQELLEAYGRLAATALVAVTAVAAAEERRQTAEALLDLAGRLHRAHTRAELATAVSQAARSVAGADVAMMLLYDDTGMVLEVAGHAGWPPELVPTVSRLRATATDTPEFLETRDNPDAFRVYRDDDPDPYMREMMRNFGSTLTTVVPVHGSERLHGVLIASWQIGSPLPAVDDALVFKLRGLTDQATNALDRAELVDRVHQQATTDALTGLANRRRLVDAIQLAVEEADSAAPPALLFVDLDRFKLVNDTLGHRAGDELLRTVAQRLATCVRTDDVVARLGGDEFTVLLPSVTDAATALELAERMVTALGEPMLVDGRTLRIRCSIGVLVVAPGEHTPSAILRDADAAMYAAKKSGGNRAVLFDPVRFGSDIDALDLESDLYTAVSERTLRLAYQPQVDLVSGAVTGVECLVRWHHPQRGTVAPDRFLPIAEATGLITSLDLLVLANACEQGASWWRDGTRLRVAINVSARTLTDPRFVPAVVEALEASGLPARALEIELTEATAIADTDTVHTVLTALRGLGVSVAVDDLGTGYSSLAWISSFPIDRIKLDRSFIADLDGGGRGGPLVEALIAMADRLGHAVLAEGVETDKQAQRLLAMGCREAQGFLLGRPTSAEEISALVATAGLATPR